MSEIKPKWIKYFRRLRLERILANCTTLTRTSYTRAMLIFKIQMFILIHFINLKGQNAAKQRMTKYHSQKSLNNNARSVVKCFPPPPPLNSLFGVMLNLRTKKIVERHLKREFVSPTSHPYEN